MALFNFYIDIGKRKKRAMKNKCRFFENHIEGELTTN